MISMIPTAQPIVILMADDDADDRLLTQDAMADARVINDLHFVTDGEELMEYLYRRGRYADAASAPRSGLILLDLNMPKLITSILSGGFIFVGAEFICLANHGAILAASPWDCCDPIHSLRYPSLRANFDETKTTYFVTRTKV
jgi:hypothetical protein